MPLRTGQTKWTLWVKRTDDYGKLRGVDPEQDVHDLKTQWLSGVKLEVDPSFVTLRLVRCAGKPTAEEEAAATVLDPWRTLREAGVADGSLLLAKVAGACNRLRTCSV